MAKTTVTVPAGGGPIEAVTTVEAVPYWTRSRRKTSKLTSLNLLLSFVRAQVQSKRIFA